MRKHRNKTGKVSSEAEITTEKADLEEEKISEKMSPESKVSRQQKPKSELKWKKTKLNVRQNSKSSKKRPLFCHKSAFGNPTTFRFSGIDP